MSETTESERRRVGACLQIGLVVADLDRAVTILSEAFGIGPFRFGDWPPPDRPDLKRYYHGQRGNFTARMAWADLGGIELEIFQPLEGPSEWSDFLRERGNGIHHLKFDVQEIEPFLEQLSRHGIEVSQRGEGLRPGTEWVYVDVEQDVGFQIELFNAAPGTGGKTPPIVDGKVQL